MARKIQKKNSVFKKTFKGGWIKEIVKRSGSGMKLDTYVYSPSGKKLNSKNELLTFVKENTKYLKNFDPTEVNFSKHYGDDETKPAPLITKFIQEIESLKKDNGLTEDNNNPILDGGKSECCKYYKLYYI